MKFTGKVWKFGDNIPTDRIVRTDMIFKPWPEILKHVLETCNPEFPANVKPGDIVVAGKHFGQSSGRAIAAKAMKNTKISCIIAEGFARTFYRNGFEIGMPILECPGITANVNDGDILSVDIETGKIINESTGREFQAEPPPPFLLDMLKAGGLIAMAERLAGEAS
jgi:3-isopropylmalate/(R)-2-methylmalate dehydratase small subunit